MTVKTRKGHCATPVTYQERRRFLFLASAIAVGLLCTAGLASGATLYWDTNGTTAGFGNTAGTWGTGGDAWWTTDSTGAFATGGTAITTATDVLHINQSNLASFSMTVSGNVDALRLVIPSNLTPSATINGPGTIRVYTSGEGNNNAVTSGHNDLKLVVNPNLVLEAAANSTVALGDLSGNNSNVTFNGFITSTNTVDLLYRDPGYLSLNATVDIKGGNFRSVGNGQFASRDQTVGGGVLGSGVHHVYRSGPQGGDTGFPGRLVLSANQAYTGDTFIDDGIIVLTANTSLPSTTSVFLTDTAAAGSPHVALNFTGSNDISGLSFLGVEQSPGTWGAIGNGSTDFESSFFTGTGVLRVVAVPEPSSFALLGLGSLLLMTRRAIVRRR